jgi:hypothetical protein
VVNPMKQEANNGVQRGISFAIAESEILRFAPQ